MEIWCEESWEKILELVERLPDHSVTYWWRDDDAVEHTIWLEKITKIAEEFACEIALATVPSKLDQSLIEYVNQHPSLVICQHGYCHKNYEKGKGYAAELGDARDIRVITLDLEEGKKILKDEFSKRFFPILVPPWNRIHEDVIRSLSGLGYVGLSTFGGLKKVLGTLVIADCHMDILKWKPKPQFRGAQKCLQDFLESVSHRINEKRMDSPTGILTHHLDHCDEANVFLRNLFIHLHQSKKFQSLSVRDVFFPRS